MKIIDFQEIVDLIAVTILLSLSFYHLIIYLGRRKHEAERYNLFFSIFAFFVAFYMFLGAHELLRRINLNPVYYKWLPPIEGLVILGVFYGFTNFLSGILQLSIKNTKMLNYAYYFLIGSMSITLLSVIIDWNWYNENLFFVVVGLTAVYVLYITAVYSYFLITQKLYKEKVVKIFLAGIFILIFYLLIGRAMLFFNYSAIYQHSNMAVCISVFVFAFALAIKFNDEYEDLVSMKNNLENLVEQRTKELLSAMDEIEKTKHERAGLKKAIEILSGHLNISSEIKADKWRIFEEKCRNYKLTDRQVELVVLVSEGLEYKEIADRLNISYKTVTRHIENLFEKLNVHNKIDLLNVLFN